MRRSGFGWNHYRLGSSRVGARGLPLCAAVSLLIVASSCSGTSNDAPASSKPAPSASAPSGGDLGPGAFRVEDLKPTGTGAARYLASTTDTPSACRFEILIEKARPVANAPFSFAPVALVRQAGSDCSAFLRTLAAQVGFAGELPTPTPVDRLPGTVAILATNQSRAASGPVAGSFSSRPAGPWTAMKLFLADGEGEVYMNINARDGVGEFSIKDEDYANIVITELAKVLRPKTG